MLEMSWINAILQLYSQVTDLFWNVIIKRISIRLFDLLARCHYILNPHRSCLVTPGGPCGGCEKTNENLKHRTIIRLAMIAYDFRKYVGHTYIRVHYMNICTDLVQRNLLY